MFNLIALLSPVIPIFILITLFKESFSLISLLALFISIYGALIFSSIQQGLKSLFPTILGFILLLTSYYMVISQNYWLLLVVPLSVIFGLIFPERITPSKRGDNINEEPLSQTYVELCEIRQELIDDVKNKVGQDFKSGLRPYYKNATGEESEVSKVIVMVLLELLKNSDYDSIIDFDGRNNEFFSLNMDRENQLIYNIVVGGALQESGNFEKADEFFNLYLEDITIDKEDVIGGVTIEQQKLLILVAELEGFGLEYKVDKKHFMSNELKEMKNDIAPTGISSKSIKSKVKKK